MNRQIVISIVSHGHGPLLQALLQDLARHCSHHELHVVLTLNIQEDCSINPGHYPFGITIHQNTHPKGFGANHNAAFHRVQGGYFCVLNPDVRLTSDPFSGLLDLLGGNVGMVAPCVVSSTGSLQPTMRRLPNPWRIFRRLLGPRPLDYDMKSGIVRPDWVGGMFMLFTRAAYEAVNGFDERYFLYYEDVDISTRLRLLGYDIQVDPRVTVIHDGTYSSHRSWKYFKYHVASMFRFFTSETYASFRRMQRRGSRIEGRLSK